MSVKYGTVGLPNVGKSTFPPRTFGTAATFLAAATVASARIHAHTPLHCRHRIRRADDAYGPRLCFVTTSTPIAETATAPAIII
jgi:hypothetical protein